MRPWGLGVWGPVHPVQPSSASPHLPETGSRRGAIGLALAGPRWVWAWTLGLMDLQLQENQKTRTPCLPCLPCFAREHGLRAPPVGTQRERGPTPGASPRLGRWARLAGGQGGQVGTLGRKPPAATGGSSSSGVQLETWARGGGRLGRQLGGPAEGCTSPPFLFALFPEYDCGNSILLVLPRPSRLQIGYRSHHEPWQHMAAVIPYVHMPAPGPSMMKQAGCPCQGDKHTQKGK